ncbi:uncharacterized protein F5Z01DRAFT_642079 [Emericellopsis atlantica]|uniref:Uncharacterized protein n=1 Tax=Emericellopsis atlantica TaxID=2614577 RepID=A0A9P7ZVD9_9HYPO|nr:uncharacterized protein F5Z01DRAFT_642079 [Emericellopsis atlantica]KAG9259028.1 hypothetical protein F5Z01DRAFT_642079 [Emericellopsis atlantica]
MCQPVAYTYPQCGHLVASRDTYDLKRCMRALSTNMDCWIKPEDAKAQVVRRTWPGLALGPCSSCARIAETKQA